MQPVSDHGIVIASNSDEVSMRVECMRSVMELTVARGLGLGWQLLVKPANLLRATGSVMARRVLPEERFSRRLFFDSDHRSHTDIQHRDGCEEGHEPKTPDRDHAWAHVHPLGEAEIAGFTSINHEPYRLNPP